MSAYVLKQENINVLTAATDAMLQLNQRYPGSYNLNQRTVDLLGKYAGDRHSIYRALYIANIKAVNGRYGEEEKTLPKYRTVPGWNVNRLDVYQLKKACGLFGCYLYQCSEDPVYGSDIYNAFYDIYKALCVILVGKSIDWHGEDREM